MKRSMLLGFKHLELVVAVAEAGTLTKAASRLYLSQSALSHQLAALERKVGSAVFLRVGRRMVPTALGVRILETARSTMDLMTHLAADLESRAMGKGTIIRIAVHAYTSYNWLPDVLRDFSPRHPAVEISLMLDATSDPVAAAIKGDVDLAITWQEVRHPQVQTTALFDDRLVIAMPASHPYASRQAVGPEDITSQQVFCHEEVARGFHIAQIDCGNARLRLNHLSYLPNTDAMLSLVRAGAGLAIVSEWQCAHVANEAGIELIPFSSPGAAFEWNAIYRRESAAPRYLTDFLLLMARSRRDRSINALVNGLGASA